MTYIRDDLCQPIIFLVSYDTSLIPNFMDDARHHCDAKLSLGYTVLID